LSLGPGGQFAQLAFGERLGAKFAFGEELVAHGKVVAVGSTALFFVGVAGHGGLRKDEGRRSK
jgi:hypothetical protein